MGLKRVWVVVVMLILLQGWWCTNGCWEQERIALLQLKHFFNDPSFLRDWVKGEESSDCCLWERVECKATTSRVTHLYLNYTRDWGSREWYLNASLFLPFEKLKALSLQDNKIAGWVENEGFEKLSSRLSNLRALDLSYNSFNDSIFSSLSRFSSLKSLYIAGNNFTGSFLNNEFNNLPSSNELEGVERLLRLINLELLDLSSNPFDNSVLSFIGRLSSLKSLYISHNKLKGSIQIKDALCNLEELDISRNEVEKFIVSKDERCLSKLKVLYLNYINTNKSILLQSLGSLLSLKSLYLKGIHSKEIIALEDYHLTNVEELVLDYSSLQINFLQGLGALTSLKNLSLSYSELNSTLTAQDLPNFKNLESLHMGGTTLNNNFLQTIGEMNSLKTLKLFRSGLNGTLPAQGLCELIHLQVLEISYNDLGGNLPDCLANLTSLQSLDFSHNQFTGNIAVSPFQSLTYIQYISISNNCFQIPISLGLFFNHSKLKYFDGGYNEIYAETQSHSLVPKFQLNYIFLYTYGYGGALPKFLYHQHDLRGVDLSHIHFTGEFPTWLLENNTGLSALYLFNNSLSGPFHLPIHSHMNLEELYISNNFISGQIPVDIGAYFPRLKYLYMSMNAFNDSIPSSFGDMKSLVVLDLSNNHLSGEIPKHLDMGCFSLSRLTLSNNSLQGQIFSASFNLANLIVLQLDGNNFTGRIPTCLSNCSMLQILDISNNHLEGTIPTELQGPLTDAFYNSSFMVTLDLSNNHITGSIPHWIKRLPKLSYLLLNDNDLEGEIPIQLCQLVQLRLIDLSHNNFFGRIPHCLQISTLNEVSTFVGAFSPTMEPIEFTTKSISYSYVGKILSSMSGIDLSCNKLTGEIPYEIGNLSDIHVLNLSYNSLSGLIPPTFGNLRQIESLDLSNNNLSGKIPQELVDLNFLAVFNVAHNNLSGKIPETAQFATFEKSSYEANPLLCGKPLSKGCYATGSPMPRASTNNEEDSGFIDMDIFYVSFTVTYVIVLLVIAAILYINPYWRRVWFYHIEMLITSCAYFVEDNLPKLFRHGNM